MAPQETDEKGCPREDPDQQGLVQLQLRPTTHSLTISTGRGK